MSHPPLPGGRPGHVVEIRPARDDDPAPADRLSLPNDRRHVRRKVLTTPGDIHVIIDLPKAIHLADRDRIVLADGLHVEVVAEEEDLFEITACSARGLTVIAWHIGNRHLAAQIEADRILIPREPVLIDMLRGLGAIMRQVREPFEPAQGAYHDNGHGHG